MKTTLAMLIAMLLPLTAFADGTSGLDRPEVVRFVHNADLCDHIAGEWDPDMTKKEKRTIEKKVDKYCGMAQKQRTKLLKKYKSDAAVLNLLNKYDSVKDYSLSP
ncbi:hypothetical protein [Rhodoferax lacus]|nr:hypothetical protein [Rhodoferax lacus]